METLVNPLVQCGLPLLSSLTTITSHCDYRASCRQMGLIPALHQFSNLFQPGLDGFDMPSVAKQNMFETGKKLGGLWNLSEKLSAVTHRQFWQQEGRKKKKDQGNSCLALSSLGNNILF